MSADFKTELNGIRIELKEIVKQLNRIEGKQSELSRINQLTLTGLVEANPQSETIKQSIQQVTPDANKRVEFKEAEANDLAEVIRLQQLQNINTTYLEDLLASPTVSVNQYKKAMTTINEWVYGDRATKGKPQKPSVSKMEKNEDIAGKVRYALENLKGKMNDWQKDFFQNMSTYSTLSLKQIDLINKNFEELSK